MKNALIQPPVILEKFLKLPAAMVKLLFSAIQLMKIFLLQLLQTAKIKDEDKEVCSKTLQSYRDRKGQVQEDESPSYSDKEITKAQDESSPRRNSF